MKTDSVRVGASTGSWYLNSGKAQHRHEQMHLVKLFTDRRPFGAEVDLNLLVRKGFKAETPVPATNPKGCNAPPCCDCIPSTPQSGAA